MNYALKVKSSSVIFSEASGYNFYFYDDTEPERVFKKPVKVLQHVKMEDKFYIKELPAGLNRKFDLNYWIELIRKPVDLTHYIWPVDIVRLPGAGVDFTYALVFPVRALPQFENITPFLSNLDLELANDGHLGWQNADIQKLATNLLNAWCSFDSSNYAYHEFSYDNMYYCKNNHDVMFDFSFSTHKASGLFDSRPIDERSFTSDYADTHFYHSGKKELDLASDYFTMATILFKLLVGRLPYHGRILEGEPNYDENQHRVWLEMYHKNPVFIFDALDESNRLSPTSSPEIYIERWNLLGESVRTMFRSVFRTANVLRKADDLVFYSPLEWKQALESNR